MLVCAGIGVWHFMFSSDDRSTNDDAAKVSAASRKMAVRRNQNHRAGRRVRRVGLRGGDAADASVEVAEVRVREKPNFAEFAEEADLTDFERDILAQIMTLVDTNDRSGLINLVSSLQRRASSSMSDLSIDRLSPTLRRALISSLGWFGANALPELLPFIADEDPSISAFALDQFVDAICDYTLSDYDRAKIIVQAAQVLTDPNSLRSILMFATDARNSVGISTLVEISKVGTPEAREIVPEQIEFFTGDDTIKTEGDAERWLAEHPDGPDDDFFYGGVTATPEDEMHFIVVKP